jgi:hypothetical protein
VAVQIEDSFGDDYLGDDFLLDDFIAPEIINPDGVTVWRQGIYKKDCVVQYYLGQFFKAVVDTSGEPARSPDWARVGTSGFRHIGAKPKDESKLAIGDIYVDGGSSFLVTESGKTGKMLARRATTKAIVDALVTDERFIAAIAERISFE